MTFLNTQHRKCCWCASLRLEFCWVFVIFLVCVHVAQRSCWFCQEPIASSKGPWATGVFRIVDNPGGHDLNMTHLSLGGGTVYRLPFSAWFCCPKPLGLHLAVSWMVFAQQRLRWILWLMFAERRPRWISGSTVRDGSASLVSWPAVLPSFAASSPLELLQDFSGAGEVVTPFLWFTAVLLAPLGSPEGLFTVSNCMLSMLGTSERGVLVTSDGLNYLDPELTNLGLSANVMRCLYAQDPVAHCLMFFLVCICVSGPWPVHRVNMGFLFFFFKKKKIVVPLVLVAALDSLRAPHWQLFCFVASQIYEQMRRLFDLFPPLSVPPFRLARENRRCFTTNVW